MFLEWSDWLGPACQCATIEWIRNCHALLHTSRTCGYRVWRSNELWIWKSLPLQFVLLAFRICSFSRRSKSIRHDFERMLLGYGLWLYLFLLIIRLFQERLVLLIFVLKTLLGVLGKLWKIFTFSLFVVFAWLRGLSSGHKPRQWTFPTERSLLASWIRPLLLNRASLAETSIGSITLKRNRAQKCRKLKTALGVQVPIENGSHQAHDLVKTDAVVPTEHSLVQDYLVLHLF